MKTLRLITAVALLCLTSIVFAQQPRHLLQNAWANIDPSTVHPEKACNYPAYSDRASWNALMSDGVGETYIQNAERYLDYVWANINATDYLEFERSGSRSVMERPFSSNRSALNTLIFGELAEGKGRFLPQIINGVSHFSHMPSWVYSAHGYRKDSGRALTDPRDVIMDLGSQSTGRIIALALHFFREEMDKVDPAIAVYADLYGKGYICQEYCRQYMTDNIDFAWGDGEWHPYINMPGLYVYNGKFVGILMRMCCEENIIIAHENERTVPVFVVKGKK